jgi:uncharacterized membrane protein
VLELKIPHGTNWEFVKPLIPVFFSYVLSFIFIGIYWGNHHHLLHTVNHVNSKIIWANLHLLFWLSLVPFATAWMGENSFEKITVAVYAAIQNICGIAYYILLRVIANNHTKNPDLLIPLKRQEKKGLLSLLAYTLAIPAAFIHPVISGALFIMVSISWLVPDKNIENSIKNRG